jgi:hypothetical protein
MSKRASVVLIILLFLGVGVVLFIVHENNKKQSIQSDIRLSRMLSDIYRIINSDVRASSDPQLYKTVRDISDLWSVLEAENLYPPNVHRFMDCEVCINPNIDMFAIVNNENDKNASNIAIILYCSGNKEHKALTGKHRWLSVSTHDIPTWAKSIVGIR